MHLSDLLGARVVDLDGQEVGRVRDVRLVQDGPLQGTFGAALRVHGLVVGPNGLAGRLGYDRHGVDGPWLVAATVRRLARRDRFAPWDAVDQIADRCVRLNCRRAELAPPEPLRTTGGAG